MNSLLARNPIVVGVGADTWRIGNNGDKAGMELYEDLVDVRARGNKRKLDTAKLAKIWKSISINVLVSKAMWDATPGIVRVFRRAGATGPRDGWFYERGTLSLRDALTDLDFPLEEIQEAVLQVLFTISKLAGIRVMQNDLHPGNIYRIGDSDSGKATPAPILCAGGAFFIQKHRWALIDFDEAEVYELGAEEQRSEMCCKEETATFLCKLHTYTTKIIDRPDVARWVEKVASGLNIPRFKASVKFWISDPARGSDYFIRADFNKTDRIRSITDLSKDDAMHGLLDSYQKTKIGMPSHATAFERVFPRPAGYVCLEDGGLEPPVDLDTWLGPASGADAEDKEVKTVIARVKAHVDAVKAAANPLIKALAVDNLEFQVVKATCKVDDDTPLTRPLGNYLGRRLAEMYRGPGREKLLVSGIRAVEASLAAAGIKPAGSLGKEETHVRVGSYLVALGDDGGARLSEPCRALLRLLLTGNKDAPGFTDTGPLWDSFGERAGNDVATGKWRLKRLRSVSAPDVVE